ncbi:HAD family hydrolase [Pendulispora albinea]|uniref:Haloacid dehalogenase n=1 Tax=Pendulispora albinea TaxID=2741071 RepID=A0ABZ2M5M4_9BACT
MNPILFTFDIFGTTLDWKRGMQEALAAHGHALTDDAFNRITAAQARLQAGPFQTYTDIVTQSLVEVVGLDASTARSIGDNVGRAPLFTDASEALTRLMRIAPCVAMTNSDRAHRAQVEAQLGFALSDWFCAEDVRAYKPSPEFWHYVARRRGLRFDKGWWHVSAYADYDLDVARSLGLTAVFVQRPHHVSGGADYEFRSYSAMADYLETLLKV